MTVTMTGMSAATAALHEALDAPGRSGASLGSWRWTVRQRMAAVRDELVAGAGDADDGWLAARSGSMLRERTALLGRLSVLGPQVLEHPDVELVRSELLRLLTDLAHHVQRVNDLVYDEVELELGGSE
ncbi:hypothetical protein [Nocardioides caricicola]|uniref:Uncharacterized protein n=1 Tax=Nocardioides caricicola TaxID=634770 RepID=A0ABW0N1U4_9ACTN